MQLAQRSGQYKALNALEIYEGQLIDWNPLTEEFQFDYKAKQSDTVIGYVGFFELLNGFKKTVYWTKQEIESHRIKNAKGFDKDKLTGAWKDNYDAMAIKTVLRNLLSKWGILSVEMQTAVASDEKVFRLDENENLIEETTLSEVEPELKEAEPVAEDVQTGLFDASNPPLNK
ncbi:recombinase RecT [Enterococcus faecium]|nr:recombinase RecT [Enterococcus faecium]